VRANFEALMCYRALASGLAFQKWRLVNVYAFSEEPCFSEAAASRLSVA